MENDIKLVAADIDGTFVRSDYTYDVPRFRRILSRMKSVGCNFVAASGNQYYQLRDLFPKDCGNDIEMLKYCGHSYAMENASREVKNAAKYLCPSNDEDGVLVTLEKIFALP